MATPINTTNEALSELQTAPGGSTPSNYRFSLAARDGWNLGVLGANTTTGYYTWGYGYGGGGGYLDAIYGLTPPTTGTNPPIALSSWKGLQYYFDGSPFDIQFSWTNNLNIPGPPTPPSANDVNIDFTFYDSSLTYSVTFGSPIMSINATAQGSQAASQIPGFIPDTFPLVKDVYWDVRATTDPVNWAGGQLIIEINGTNVLNTGLTNGANNFDYTSGSAGATNGTGILIDFLIQ